MADLARLPPRGGPAAVADDSRRFAKPPAGRPALYADYLADLPLETAPARLRHIPWMAGQLARLGAIALIVGAFIVAVAR